MSARFKSVLCLSLLLLYCVMVQADITDKLTTIKLWDVRTGKEIKTASQIEHKSDVFTIAFSPDGKILASGGKDNVVRLSSTETGKELEILGGQVGHKAPLKAVAFSPNGQFLASASEDRTVKLWEVRSQKEPRTLSKHQGSVNCLAFSHDGKILASGSADKTIRLWNVETGKELDDPITDHKAAINSLVFSPDDRTLISGSSDKTVRIWDVDSQKQLRSLVGHTAAVTSIAVSPDGKTIASGSDDDLIKLWDARPSSTDKPMTLAGHRGPITSVAFNHEGALLASGSWDGTVKFWSVKSGQAEKTLKGHSYRVTAVAFSPDKVRFASSTIASTEPAPSSLFIVTVGLKSYRAPLSPVDYAALDTQEFAAAVGQGGKDVFQRINKYVLVDSDATLSKIKTTLDEVKAQAQPQDTFIFYFVGHAKISSEETTPRDCYLLTGDISNQEGESALSATSLSAGSFKDWLSELPSQKQLIILNCPERTEFFNIFSEHFSGKSSKLNRFREGGIVLLGVDGALQGAATKKEVQVSPFTSALLQGITEETAGGADGKVTARKLEGYLFRNLSTLSNYQQIPRAWHDGNDFPVLNKNGDANERAVATKEKPARPGKFYALLVAGEKYEDPNWPRLANPPNDVRAVSEALVRIYGFEEPEILLSPTFEELYDVLFKYKNKKFEENDALLIFFAGHGDVDRDREEGFVVTKTSRSNDKAKRDYLGYSTLRTLADKIPCKHILIVLDVCFGGMFNPELRRSAIRTTYQDDASVNELVQRKMRFTTREFLASTGDAYASDGTSGAPHSPFAGKFLEALESYGSPSGVLTIGDIKKYVDALKTQPFYGSFGSHNARSEFILIVK